MHYSNGEQACGGGFKEESFPASCEVTLGYDEEDHYVSLGVSSVAALSSMVLFWLFALLS